MRPERDHAFQFVQDPLIRRECGAAMSSRHANHDGRLTGRNKSNPVPDKNLARAFEFFCRVRGDDSHLVFRHFPMRFVFNAAYFAAIFRRSNRTPENNDSASLRIVILRGQIEWRFCD